MLDNGQVETQQIKDIQEEIDNYIENSQEPDFYENEYIYDDTEGLEAMLLDVRPDQHSVEASETASSTNSVSGSSPVLGQSANHSSSHLPREEDLKRRHRRSGLISLLSLVADQSRPCSTYSFSVKLFHV